MTTVLQLRPYQQAALDAIAEARERGLTRVLVQMATGLGKTVVFAHLPTHPPIAAWLSTFPARERKMLVIAHREELLDQAADKIMRVNPHLLVTIEQGDRHASPHSDVVIASIQTLAALKCRRLHRLLQRHTFRLVVVDEAHHISAPSYRTALVHLGFLPPADASEVEDADAASYEDIETMERALQGWEAVAPKDRLLVGVTATPNRSDGIGLGCVLQSIVYQYGIKGGVDDGWLVPIVPWAIETHVGLDDVKVSHGDFVQRDLEAAVNLGRRNQLAVAAWREHAKDRPTIAFTVGVQHAHDLAQTFQQAGVRAQAVSGETPKEIRRQMFADFSARRIDVLTNCMIVSEGVDLPLASCILLARPTKSATLLTQFVGRGLRTHPDKTSCVVIDLVDVSRKHSLQAVPVLYGLPPGLKTAGDDLRTMEGDLEALKERFPNVDIDRLLAEQSLTLAQLSAKASTFDVWTVQPLGELAHGLALNWIKAGADTFRLQFPWGDGTEVLVVQKDMLGKFDVSSTYRPFHPAGGTGVRQRTLAAGITTPKEALALAETYVNGERHSAMGLKDRSAPWRQRPASPKQLGLLRKWKVPYREADLLVRGGAGTASDLIDLAVATRQAGGRR
jgi:ATP-dependent helicase IRC3